MSYSLGGFLNISDSTSEASIEIVNDAAAKTCKSLNLTEGIYDLRHSSYLTFSALHSYFYSTPNDARRRKVSREYVDNHRSRTPSCVFVVPNTSAGQSGRLSRARPRE